jgi:hypothetical protein
MIRSGDTSAEANTRQLDDWRRMTPQERLAIAADTSDALRRLVEAGVRSRHPDAAALQVQAAVAEELAAALRRRQAELIE